MQKHVVCLLSVFSLMLPLQARAAAETPAAAPAAPATAPAAAPVVVANPFPETVTDLLITEKVIGSGEPVLKEKHGKLVAIHFTGWIYDSKAPEGHGAKFASTRDNDKPYLLSVGEGKVIRGLEAGIIGMKVGGKRTILIPSKLGYGATIIPNKVPANSDLIFDVEMLDKQQ